MLQTYTTRLNLLSFIHVCCDPAKYLLFIMIPPWLPRRPGYGSESEVDDEAATVSLPTDLGRLNRASNKSAVKLQEIGPRMTLQLVRIEEGLCSGGIIFSEFGKTSAIILLTH